MIFMIPLASPWDESVSFRLISSVGAGVGAEAFSFALDVSRRPRCVSYAFISSNWLNFIGRVRQP